MRTYVKLLLGLWLVGCASGVEEEEYPFDPFLNKYIAFTPMFSAFDGVHDYAVTPSILRASENSKDVDTVMVSSIRWYFDDAFVAKRGAFPDLPAGIELTTKKAGLTTVGVTGKYFSGAKFRSEAKLTISKATASEWEAGEARFNNGDPNQSKRTGRFQNCGLATTVIDLPGESACSTCHSMTNGFKVELTPTQTAGYSNEDLIKIFTEGEKPAGGTFNSVFLRNAPMPDCIYKDFHTWGVTDEEKIGLVWKLRSLTPKVQEEQAD